MVCRLSPVHVLISLAGGNTGNFLNSIPTSLSTRSDREKWFFAAENSYAQMKGKAHEKLAETRI